jgi:23S rRNA pseudouridine1911/1915/1917 synthase
LEKLFAIIHEDADLLVVHKPADLVCHPTKGDEYSSLISRARIYLERERSAGGPPASGEAGSQVPPIRSSTNPSSIPSSPHLVNRLDRETSGLMLIAKTPHRPVEGRCDSCRQKSDGPNAAHFRNLKDTR